MVSDPAPGDFPALSSEAGLLPCAGNRRTETQSPVPGNAGLLSRRRPLPLSERRTAFHKLERSGTEQTLALQSALLRLAPAAGTRRGRGKPLDRKMDRRKPRPRGKRLGTLYALAAHRQLDQVESARPRTFGDGEKLPRRADPLSDPASGVPPAGKPSAGQRQGAGFRRMLLQRPGGRKMA